MALAATTLAGAKALNDKVIRVTTGTGFQNKMLALVDGEFMRVTSVDLQPTIGVVPGYNGTPASPHGVLAPVIYGVASDWPAVSTLSSSSIGVSDTAYTPPVVDQTVFLTKATALAVTLVNPGIGQQNTVTFVQASAAAHVITYTQGFYGDTTGSDTATFPTGGGGVFTMRANNGAWVPVATASLGVIIG